MIHLICIVLILNKTIINYIISKELVDIIYIVIAYLKRIIIYLFQLFL